LGELDGNGRLSGLCNSLVFNNDTGSDIETAPSRWISARRKRAGESKPDGLTMASVAGHITGTLEYKRGINLFATKKGWPGSDVRLTELFPRSRRAAEPDRQLEGATKKNDSVSVNPEPGSRIKERASTARA
jgi:hypothetical protein